MPSATVDNCTQAPAGRSGYRTTNIDSPERRAALEWARGAGRRAAGGHPTATDSDLWREETSKRYREWAVFVSDWATGEREEPRGLITSEEAVEAFNVGTEEARAGQ